MSNASNFTQLKSRLNIGARLYGSLSGESVQRYATSVLSGPDTTSVASGGYRLIRRRYRYRISLFSVEWAKICHTASTEKILSSIVYFSCCLAFAMPTMLPSTAAQFSSVPSRSKFASSAVRRDE